ncbi:ABC transporter [Streptomyces sp. ODS28]|uniref:ABC transporter n=1 Tax=Streptomyces sp. ODS28 TaxID=3136688 RepID=UPI0031EAFFA0
MNTLAALVGYHFALLLRSQRWLPPLLLYAALLVVAVQWGQPVLDSLGYAAAVLLPVTAWLVRICVTAEPEAARHVLAAAAGPRRVHLSSVLTAAAAASVCALAGTAGVLAVCDPHTNDHRTPVSLPGAACAGLVAALTCVLLGAAVGALCSRPLLRSTGRAVPAMLLAVLLVLVSGASPANAAVSGLVTGSRDGTVAVPWAPCAAGVLAFAACAAVACAPAGRRTP